MANLCTVRRNFVLLWYPLLVACSIGKVEEQLKAFLSSFVGVKNSRFFLSVEKYLQQVCFSAAAMLVDESKTTVSIENLVT